MKTFYFILAIYAMVMSLGNMALGGDMFISIAGVIGFIIMVGLLLASDYK